MGVDALRAPAAARQSTGVVKDVRKSAQAGIGGRPHLLVLETSCLLRYLIQRAWCSADKAPITVMMMVVCPSEGGYTQPDELFTSSPAPAIKWSCYGRSCSGDRAVPATPSERRDVGSSSVPYLCNFSRMS